MSGNGRAQPGYIQYYLYIIAWACLFKVLVFAEIVPGTGAAMKYIAKDFPDMLPGYLSPSEDFHMIAAIPLGSGFFVVGDKPHRVQDFRCGGRLHPARYMLLTGP